jgi:hypothetical protein
MIILKAKNNFYKWFRTPKTPTELGRLILDYKPEFYAAIKNALQNNFITPDLLLEFSVISYNINLIELAIKNGAQLDKLAPPFGIEIRRKRHTPILHILFDNNVKLFIYLIHNHIEVFTPRVIRMLLKGMSENRALSTTVISILELIKESFDTLNVSEILFEIAIKRNEILIKKSVLSFPCMKAVIDHDFIVKQNYDVFPQLGPYVVKFLIKKLEKDNPDTLLFINKLLIHGAAINALDFCELLIRLGADIDFTHEKMIRPETPLSESLRSGNLSISEMLINKGANIRYSKRKYHNLIDAIRGGLESIALIILEKDAHISNEILSKSLHFAIESSHIFSLSFYETLLIRGADPLYSESGFFNSMNALYSAIVRSKIDAFSLLIDTINKTYKDSKFTLCFY